jgi:hypothetical protein
VTSDRCPRGLGASWAPATAPVAARVVFLRVMALLTLTNPIACPG